MIFSHTILVKKNTQKDVYKWTGLPGHSVCFAFRTPEGSPGKVHMYRKIDPGSDQKDLGIHIGSLYFRAKEAEYDIRVEAIDTDVYVDIRKDK